MDYINIFESIILSSFMGSLLILMILIVKGIFRDKLSYTFQYYMWIILLIKLIIPFGLQTPLNICDISEKLYVKSMVNTKTQKIQINSLQQNKNIKSDESVSIVNSQTSNKSVISNDGSKSIKNKLNIANLLCYMWTFGVVLLIINLFIEYKNLREIVRASSKNINRAHKEIFHNCINTMNIRANVEILYSCQVSSPSVCGILKPKILIPVNVAANVSGEEFKCVIMHELAHLKSKDIFINWIITLLSIIYWFNPVLLYGFHKIRQDCEFHCDSQVISYLEESENVQYGNALIRILELGTKSKKITGATSMVMNNFELKRRIIMISKYEKINIKNIILGCFAVIIIAGLGIAINVSNSSSDKNISKTKMPLVPATATAAKNPVNSTETKASSIKALPSNNTNVTAPFASGIVIYNSHPDEAYPSGIKVTDVAALINNKLVKEGIKSSFIKCNPPSDYTKSYQATRDLITNNVRNYSTTILLDIHRDIAANTKKGDTKKILFILAKNNPHYAKNKQFTDSLIKNIKNSSQVRTDIYSYERGIDYFNQDLSINSAFIEIGNDMSSDSDIEECINALASALKNTQKVSNN